MMKTHPDSAWSPERTRLGWSGRHRKRDHQAYARFYRGMEHKLHMRQSVSITLSRLRIYWRWRRQANHPIIRNFNNSAESDIHYVSPSLQRLDKHGLRPNCLCWKVRNFLLRNKALVYLLISRVYTNWQFYPLDCITSSTTTNLFDSPSLHPLHFSIVLLSLASVLPTIFISIRISTLELYTHILSPAPDNVP